MEILSNHGSHSITRNEHQHCHHHPISVFRRWSWCCSSSTFRTATSHRSWQRDTSPQTLIWEDDYYMIQIALAFYGALESSASSQWMWTPINRQFAWKQTSDYLLYNHHRIIIFLRKRTDDDATPTKQQFNEAKTQIALAGKLLFIVVNHFVAWWWW